MAWLEVVTARLKLWISEHDLIGVITVQDGPLIDRLKCRSVLSCGQYSVRSTRPNDDTDFDSNCTKAVRNIS